MNILLFLSIIHKSSINMDTSGKKPYFHFKERSNMKKNAQNARKQEQN